MNDETRNMMLKTTPRGRIKNFLNSLALKPIKTSRLMRCCALCACPIQPGEQLRDAGETALVNGGCN